ncbi:MAG TPA: BatD family protein [Gemmataceae bacterium]|nr:BatD family protein [Gemmataceae bacterium]
MRIAVLLILLSPASARAQGPLPDLPVKGRPLYFDEERSPIGSFHTPAVRAEPTELPAQDPLTFTVRITASGPVFRPPARPRLQEFPGFLEQFDIEDIPNGDGRLDERTWEFAYRLRPRHEGVQAIPSFPFVFFTPGYLPAHKGYQTRHTAPIGLTVKPRPKVRLADVQGKQPPRAPDVVYQLAEGAAVLRRDRVESLPGPGVLAALLLAPPLVCMGWYAAWRRFYPEAVQLVRRRSRAVRLALRALQAIGPADAATQAERATAIVIDYLRQRFDLPGAQPTPAEVSAHLRQAGVAADLAEQTAEFFGTCDGIRYAPLRSVADEDLKAAAERLILALEEASEAGQRTVAAGAFAILGLLIAPHTASAAVTDLDLVARAEAAFREGVRLADDGPAEARRSFREAARLYAELRGRGFCNAALCRNEGNAWLLGGDVARAILAYRRGLRLAPGDHALGEGLAHARDQVVYSSPGSFGRPTGDSRPPWLLRLSLGKHLGLALGCYSLGCLALTRWWMTRRPSLPVIGGAALFVAATLGVLLAIREWQDRQEARYPLVVIADDGVLLYKGNGLAYPHYETPLNAGVEARLLFVRGDWLQIELAGGEVGWVPQKYVLRDEPPG